MSLAWPECWDLESTEDAEARPGTLPRAQPGPTVQVSTHNPTGPPPPPRSPTGFLWYGFSFFFLPVLTHSRTDSTRPIVAAKDNMTSRPAHGVKRLVRVKCGDILSVSGLVDNTEALTAAGPSPTAFGR